jgi:ribonucleotide monophosphatase NagD (HAD superfamily)
VFVTNNSTKSRAGYTSKFKSLGLNVTAEEIFSSSFAAAAYLESTNFPKDKKVYVVGEVGIQQELDLVVSKLLLPIACALLACVRCAHASRAVHAHRA